MASYEEIVMAKYFAYGHEFKMVIKWLTLSQMIYVSQESDFPKYSVITESLKNYQNNEIFKYLKYPTLLRYIWYKGTGIYNKNRKKENINL